MLKRFARDRQIGARSRHHLSPGREGARGARGAAARRRLWSRRIVCRAAAGADGLQAHRARARPRRAPAHAGHLGAVAQEDPDARIQRAVRRGRGGPVLRRQALQPDQGSEVLRPQGDARVRARGRAGRNPVRQQAAHRHVPAHRHRREDARGDHRARRRGALREQGDGRADRHRPGSKASCSRTARRCPAGTWCSRSDTARATRCACSSGAAFSSRRNPSRSAFASNIRSRSSTARGSAVSPGHPELGAADYKLVHHASNGRSVYSFCMCPGGTVVAATSEAGRVVTNGMSQYSRNERNANAGIVVAINPETGFSRRPARGRRAAGAARVEGVRARRPRLLRARPARGRLRARRGLHAAWARFSPRTSRA